MSEITRLAILDRGEPAVRIVAAVGSYNRSSGTAPITTVLAHTDARPRPWYAGRPTRSSCCARAPAARWPCRTRPPTRLRSSRPRCRDPRRPPGATRCGSAWFRARTTRARRGLRARRYDGHRPGQRDHRQTGRPGRSRGGAEEGQGPRGARCRRPAHRERSRSSSLADSAGTVWAMDPRDVSVRRGGEIVLVESPPRDRWRRARRDPGRRWSVAAAAGVRGASVVQFSSTRPGRSGARGSTPWPSPGTPSSRRPGTSILPLRLVIAAGGHLAGTPRREGQILSARLLASDPEAAFAASGGTVEALAQPVGTGVRVDSSLREGDVVDGAVDPVIATFTARGHDRAGGLLAHGARHRADHPSSWRSVRATAAACWLCCASPELRAGGVPSAGMTPSSRPDRCACCRPVALIAAAIGAYEADLSLVRSAFFASAERVAPSTPKPSAPGWP